MRTLITGATGLIGSHLAEKAFQMGDEVGLIIRKKNNIIDSLKGEFSFFHGDIINPKFVLATIEKFKPNRIFHFAAQSLPTLSWLEASNTFRVNIEGTYNILNSISEVSPNSLLIFAGSSSEYANLYSQEPIKETAPLEPKSIYGISKLTDFYLLKLFKETKNIRTIYTRPFFVIGPRKTGDVSSDFARSIVNIENKRLKFLGHGNLNAVRDFLDIEDCVEAYFLLSELGKYGEVYNVCSGTGIKISTLLDSFCKLSKCKIITKEDIKYKRRIDEVIRIGDPSKLNALGWSRKILIEESVQKILNYWRKNT